MIETSLERAQQAVPPFMGTVELADQGVIFRRAALQLRWIAYFLISLDFPVTVIQPIELRDILREIATKALRIVGDTADQAE
ncbi:MAG: WYL domain-containing protein [Chloroflexota bacterium]